MDPKPLRTDQKAVTVASGTKSLEVIGVLALLCVSLMGPLGAVPAVQEKIAPGLQEELVWMERYPAYDYPMPVIIQVKESVFRDVLEARRLRGEDRANMLPLVNGFTGRLTGHQIRSLVQSDQIEYVTLDMPLHLTGKPDKGDKGGGGTPEGGIDPVSYLSIIGADYAAGYDGSGITVAVFDSGIRSHSDLALKGNSVRITETYDFSIDGTPISKSQSQDFQNLDLFGHGTHVTGIIGGSGNKSDGVFAGVAPKVRFIDLQVVNAEGYGQTSNLIAAIDWLIANNDSLDVRVANLSLGHGPIESYAQDPLCQAVERMVAAGIVTVVSAGNLGKTDTEPTIWGAITSPGNSPAVITVGPINTQGTLTHTDDIATTYGSRGPTYLDQFFKPDLVAPGNAIGSLLAKNSKLHNDYLELQIDDYYITLSGSSMATGYVSGAAALMLDANPDLTPRLVKAILILSASKLQQPHMLEQGNGMLNVATAVALAEAVDVANQQVAYAVAPYWDLDGEQIWAGGAFGAGDRLVYSPLIGAPTADLSWGQGELWSDQLAYTDGTSWTDGLFDPGSVVWDSGFVWSDSFFWSDSVFWADGVFWSDGLFASDSFLWSDGFLWSDAVFWSDAFLWADGSEQFQGDGAHDFRGDH